MTRLFREERWPSHSGRVDMPLHEVNVNDSREVRCAGNDLMPSHEKMTRLFSEERWPSHSGRVDMPLHEVNVNDSREVRCRMLSGTFVR